MIRNGFQIWAAAALALGACGVGDVPDGPAGLELGANALPCGAMNGNQALSPGNSVLSCNGKATLVHQTDGNVVLYDQAGALWSTGTAGKATSSFVMQTDGNLVLYGSAALWDAHTSGHSGAHLAIQDDCNLVIYATNGAVLWTSHTACRGGTTPPPSSTAFGIVSGRIYSSYDTTWTLDSATAVTDLQHLGAKWIRVDVLPDCPAGRTDGCEPAGTYAGVFRALHNGGLKVLALVNVPSLDRQKPSPGGADEWWSNVYEPRVEQVLGLSPDAIELINEPNNNGYSADDFGLIVKRTYEKQHDVLKHTTPIIAGGILNAYDDSTYNDVYHRAVLGSKAYRDYLAAYGRLPMDGWGIHPYQKQTWFANRGNLGAYLRSSLQTIRNVIGHPEVPFWVTEFGWQHGDACGVANSDEKTCDTDIQAMMPIAFSAFRDPASNVAVALWYDYRDDQGGGEQYGLRHNAGTANYGVKAGAGFNLWTAFQQAAGGSGPAVGP